LSLRLVSARIAARRPSDRGPPVRGQDDIEQRPRPRGDAGFRNSCLGRALGSVRVVGVLSVTASVTDG
jgi:hypothetical protein